MTEIAIVESQPFETCFLCEEKAFATMVIVYDRGRAHRFPLCNLHKKNLKFQLRV